MAGNPPRPDAWVATCKIRCSPSVEFPLDTGTLRYVHLFRPHTSLA